VPARDHGASRISHILSALKSFLRFCTLAVGLETMDLRQIRLPRIPKREVQFLTPDEIRQYVAAIPLRKGPRSYDVDWLSFRVLVEVLLGSGARISEALSLKRTSINLQTGEATIIGKGDKGARVVFVDAPLLGRGLCRAPANLGPTDSSRHRPRTSVSQATLESLSDFSWCPPN
jgi:site-specific recombinase XerD